MKVSSTTVHATVDSDLLELARQHVPAEMNQSTMLRYALALAAEFPEDEALDEAIRPMGRPPKKPRKAV